LTHGAVTLEWGGNTDHGQKRGKAVEFAVEPAIFRYYPGLYLLAAVAHLVDNQASHERIVAEWEAASSPTRDDDCLAPFSKACYLFVRTRRGVESMSLDRAMQKIINRFEKALAETLQGV
jgi:hypothetical protein